MNLPKTLSFFLLLLFPFIVYAQNQHCQVLRYVSTLDMKTNKVVVVDTVVYQVNDRYGEQYTEVSVPFSKNQNISGLKAWIEDANGVLIRKMSSNEVKEHSAISNSSLFEDDYVKEFQLKHTSYPYRFCYTYTSTERNTFVHSWTPIVKHAVPTLYSSLTVSALRNFKLHLYTQNIEKASVDSTVDDINYVWHSNYTKELKDEDFAVPFFKIIPKVSVVPSSFNCGVDGSNDSWALFGNWQWRLSDKLNDLLVADKSAVNQLVAGVTNLKEKVRILYHYLQDHTRYVNVTLGIGGWKPYPASYVAANKYGDCKALTNYMKALLDAVGIKSYYCLVYAGDDIPEYHTDEVYFFFNHAILMVPLANDTIWLENTNKSNPFAHMGTFTQNRAALLIDNENSHFVRIPALTDRDVAVVRNFTIRFNEFGQANLSTHFSYNGHLFESFTGLLEGYNSDEQDLIVRKYLSFPNTDLLEWKIVERNRDSASIALVTEQTMRKELKPLGTDRYFGLIPADFPDLKAPSVRVLPVSMAYPVNQIDSFAFVLPVNFELKSLPSNVDLKSEYGIYTLSFAAVGNRVNVVRHFKLYASSCSLNQYPTLYQFITSAKDADKTKIMLKQNQNQ